MFTVVNLEFMINQTHETLSFETFNFLLLEISVRLCIKCIARHMLSCAFLYLNFAGKINRGKLLWYHFSSMQLKFRAQHLLVEPFLH